MPTPVSFVFQYWRMLLLWLQMIKNKNEKRGHLLTSKKRKNNNNQPVVVRVRKAASYPGGSGLRMIAARRQYSASRRRPVK